MNDMKKKVLLKTITLENVFSVSAYSLPFTGVCKRFLFLSNFTIHYYSCAQHFLRLISPLHFVNMNTLIKADNLLQLM